jgi:membrane protease YdiL (CAAX protease family)
MDKVTWKYIFITFLVTWGIILPSYYSYQRGDLSLNQLNLIYNLGALGPFVGAIISTQTTYGKQGVRKLFSTFSLKKLNRKSLLIALSPLLFFFAGLLLYPVFSGHWYTFADTRQQFSLSTPMTYVNWLLPFITYSILEEFGWRGFLLPHLQSKYSAFISSMILTVFWATWHLPFFLWRFQFSGFITIGFFFALFIGSIILTSAFNLSSGSIAATILFHFCNNVASALDKEYIVAIVSTGFVFLAVYLVKTYKTEHLANIPRTQNFFPPDQHFNTDKKIRN